MKKIKNILFYVFIIGGFSFLMSRIVHLGEKNLQPGNAVIESGEKISHWSLFTESFLSNMSHPLAILLLQIVTIILVARLFSWICKKIGQPSVIGEIVAGIVLGPSLVGYYFPEFSNFMFPVQSLNNLQFLSHIGLILFMFVVGMELDLKVLKKQAHEAIVVSHASIIIPFALGLGLAYFIYQSFAPQGVPFISFGLFLGISMSITAFPVLARIVQEKGIHKTKLGTIVITCAAADDITAWSLLAAVIAIVKAGSFISSLPTIIMAIAYVFILLKVVKPFLKRVGELHSSRENLSKPVVALFFLILLLSAYTTEIIGIHALFGAFMAGAVMPDNAKFKNIFIEKVEDVALVLLLPLFFVYTGLRTELGLLNDPYLWKVCAMVILVAVTGKFVGSAIAAKFTGQNWHDSLTIGALMNTRGLVELVALNIGYDLGVLTPEIFTMLVIMALITTFMTAPALHLIEKLFRKKETSISQEIEDLRKYNILISFGNPEMGKTLLKLADTLARNNNGNTTITALHLSPAGLFAKYKADSYENDSFEQIITESLKLNRKIKTLYKVSENIENDIIDITNKGEYDLLLVGIGQSIYKGSMLGNILNYSTNFLQPDRLYNKITGKEKVFSNAPFSSITMQILDKSKSPVGILINNNLQQINRVFIPVYSNNDTFLIEYAKKFITNSGVQITVIETGAEVKMDNKFKENVRFIGQFAPDNIVMYNKGIYDDDLIRQHDLMLISLDGWTKFLETKNNWTENNIPVLVLRHYKEK